ncbi:MAG: lipoyl synthase [Pirellulales bacterium]
MPKGVGGHLTARLLDELALETVCENARCPNRMECYSRHTATFLILGNVCTRHCGFCAVARGTSHAVAEDEPARVAQASLRLGLKHVVITSVTRDDLADGGAEQFFRSVEEVRRVSGATVEVLTPDFAGNAAAVDRVVEAAPEVFNHNVETVPRLYRRVRGRQARYDWTLALLRRVGRRNPAIHLKSGLMLGLGETVEELFDTLADLREVGCRMLTLGQYLAPSPRHLPVVRYVPPEEFDTLGEAARRMGFAEVASGPFVRSSYRAARMLGGRGLAPSP